MFDKNQLYLYAIHLLSSRADMSLVMQVIHDGPCPLKTELYLSCESPESMGTEWAGFLRLWVEAVEAGKARCTVEKNLDEIYIPYSVDVVMGQQPRMFAKVDWMGPWQAVVLWMSDHPIDPSPLLECFRLESDGKYYMKDMERFEDLVEQEEKDLSRGTHKW